MREGFSTVEMVWRRCDSGERGDVERMAESSVVATREELGKEEEGEGIEWVSAGDWDMWLKLERVKPNTNARVIPNAATLALTGALGSTLILLLFHSTHRCRATPQAFKDE